MIVTSCVFRDGAVDWDCLRRIRKEAGRERLVLDLSCRRKGENYYIVTDRWQKFTDVALSAAVLDDLAGYCAEFLVHAVDVEGKELGRGRLHVTIGSALDLFGGEMNYEEVVKFVAGSAK